MRVQYVLHGCICEWEVVSGDIRKVESITPVEPEKNPSRRGVSSNHSIPRRVLEARTGKGGGVLLLRDCFKHMKVLSHIKLSTAHHCRVVVASDQGFRASLACESSDTI